MCVNAGRQPTTLLAPWRDAKLSQFAQLLSDFARVHANRPLDSCLQPQIADRMSSCAPQALEPVMSFTPDTSSGTADAITRYVDAHQARPHVSNLHRCALTCSMRTSPDSHSNPPESGCLRVSRRLPTWKASSSAGLSVKQASFAFDVA